MRHALRLRLHLQALQLVTQRRARVRLADAEALGDDRAEVIRHELAERAVVEREGRCRQVHDELGVRRDLVCDLEVEHDLADRRFRLAPFGVLLDGQHLAERRQPELDRELVEVRDVALRQLFDLREHDRLARAVEVLLAQGGDVVEVHEVSGREAAGLHGVPAQAAVAV